MLYSISINEGVPKVYCLMFLMSNGIIWSWSNVILLLYTGLTSLINGKVRIVKLMHMDRLDAWLLKLNGNVWCSKRNKRKPDIFHDEDTQPHSPKLNDVPSTSNTTIRRSVEHKCNVTLGIEVVNIVRIQRREACKILWCNTSNYSR